MGRHRSRNGRAREIIGRLALGASVILLVVAAAAPGSASDAPVRSGPPDDPMCSAVPIGAAAVDVNGVTAHFRWSEEGIAWTTDGVASDRHFRVTIKAESGIDTVWGETASWSGTGVRAVRACYCPPTDSKQTTTTKATTTTVDGQEGSTTVATTPPGSEPTEPTQASTVTTAAVEESTTTTAATTTAATTVATTSATTTATVESTTAPTTAATTRATAAATPPTVQVLAAVLQPAQEELPETGLETRRLALFGALLLGVGGMALIVTDRRARFG